MSNHTTTTSTTSTNSDALTSARPSPPLHRPASSDVRRAIVKRSFCTLASVSPAGRPHAAGVLYAVAGDRLYVSTLRSSRKARNIAHAGHVAVVIPVRRVPVGGAPSAIQFQATATLLATDDDEITGLVAAGELASITGHGELELPDGCFIAVDLPPRMHTYGLGMSLVALIRDPLDAAGIVEPAEK